MKHFLSIILRNQFNLFYRFGYTVIPKAGLIEFGGIINAEVRQDITNHFKNVTPFEYDEEYLILHLEKPSINDSDNFIEFEIQELISIYPLSQQAKVSIESKIDQRIRLELPIFETELAAIETEIEKKEVRKAISALWKICNIEVPIERYISEIGLHNIFSGLRYRLLGTKASKIQNGNYWEYLIAYDRFDYFPNSTLGYFYDAGQVFAYSKGHTTFEGSGMHKFVEKLNIENPTIKLLDIIKYLETDEQPRSYVSQTTTETIKQSIVTPLYLMLRDEIRKSEDVTQTKLFKNIDYLKGLGDSFYYAVILLGAFFGFRKFYDPYYEVLNLRFYRDTQVQTKQAEKEEQGKSNTMVLDNNKPSALKQRKSKPKQEEKVEKPKIEQPQKINDQIEIQPEEKQTDISKSDTPYIQTNHQKELVSDFVVECQKIIEESLDGYKEIKLSDIVKIIKDKTGNNVNIVVVKNIVKQLSGIEIFKIGNANAIKRITNYSLNLK